MRVLSLGLAAIVAVLFSVNSSTALMIAYSPPYQRALTAEAVVVGKVTSIEKETVEVEDVKGGPKRTYHVALVKIDNALKGVAGLTHIKVGFIPGPEVRPGAAPGIRPIPRRGLMGPQLKEGDEFLLFLDKHNTASFHVINGMNPPVDMKSEEAKPALEAVKKVVAVTSNPKAALTAAKAEDRFYAAAVLLMKYRQPPRGGAQVEQVAIPADESALILKGLLEGNWEARNGNAPSAMSAIGMLGLTAKDGFQYPKIKPGQQPGELYKKAFEKWRNGPGKDYVIKQMIVPTK